MFVALLAPVCMTRSRHAYATQETAAVRVRPLSGPPSRNHYVANAGGFRGNAAEPLSATFRHGGALSSSKPPLKNSKQHQGVVQLAAATPLAASRSTVPGSASCRTSIGERGLECVVSLPGGVTHAVAGAACSLLLRTEPASDVRMNWEVSLMSYSEESLRNTGRNPQQNGIPVVFALGACSGGVQNCSFVATQAGIVVCRARARARAAAPCSFSFKVVASEPSASASSIFLVHPLPSIDTVEVGREVPLRLMVRMRACRLTDGGFHGIAVSICGCKQS